MPRSSNHEIRHLVEALATSEDGGHAMLAVRLGVSASSISRWLSGKACPQPDIERLIRSLAAKRGIAQQLPLFQPAVTADESELRASLVRTLRQVRELLHSKGRLSSRHEALDEIAKLLFAHVISIDTGGRGICVTAVPKTPNSARVLKSFVRDTFRAHLPVSLSHELTPSDFELRLKESESAVANGLVECFEPLASPSAVRQFKDLGAVDLLNDTFGQFLVDSFADEKELGQYLTPPEVVRFMVRLGLESLSNEHKSALLSLGDSNPGIILDPSCGVGSFLAETMRVLLPQVRAGMEAPALGAWISRTLRDVVVGIDKSERMIRLALTNLALFGAPTVNLHLANALARSGPDSQITDALNNKACLILTNPPFGASFDKRDVGRYRLARDWSNGSGGTIDSELLFLERYLDWLVPAGVLIAVVPDSVLTNQGLFSELRAGLAPAVELLSVISLPPVTFAAAGTSTKTSILHLRKRSETGTARSPVYFGICEQIGFDVTTRGSLRARVSTGKNDLDSILLEAIGQSPPSHGVRCEFVPSSSRWDARYNVGLPSSIQDRIERPRPCDVRLGDLAALVNDRINPVRFGNGEFSYIEIADIDSQSCDVRSKPVDCRNAPSRARKRVKAGDVLVSTVRPERRAVGVVPTHLDGAVCSTGIAVLRPTRIPSLVLARLIQSDFVNTQLLRNNIGIAYPAFDESCLPKIVIPLHADDVKDTGGAANQVSQLRDQLREAEEALASQMQVAVERWLRG